MRHLREACRQRLPHHKLAEELATVLLAPVSRIVEEHQRLIIVPYGEAHTLPFHVLPWAGRPLGTVRTLSYLPSASTLQFLRSASTAAPPESVLAVGDPVRMAEPAFARRGPAQLLRPLAGAAAEALFVARSFPRGEALVGAQATKQAVRERMKGRDVLHFATHGVLSTEVPLLSCILLAEGESLSVYELMGERIEARLVVLSACETGLGKKTGGDDVLGLARGLLAAGAKSAIVSLWPVDDHATFILMEELYRRLRAGETAASALQAAQVRLHQLSGQEAAARLRELEVSTGSSEPVSSEEGAAFPPAFDHPYYWAPFILVGTD